MKSMKSDVAALVGGLFGPKQNGESEEKVRMKRPTEGDATRTGPAKGEDEERRPKAGGEEKRPTRERKGAIGAARKPAKGAKGVSAGEGAGKSVPTYVRLPEAMVEAIEKAVSDSPIEFGSASEFIRRAIETELRRRGLVSQYK